MEIKIFVAYIVICFYYTACRMHYLITQKEDEEFNELFGEIANLISKKSAIIIIASLQLFLSPILAPFSMTKRIYCLVFPKKHKKDK